MTPSPPPSSVLDTCVACTAGHHAECTATFREPAPEFSCCCAGQVTLREVHLWHSHHEQELTKSIFGEEAVESGRRGNPDAIMPGGVVKVEKLKGKSGYIHPDAWPSTKDIGTFVDPESTGRKRMAEMYPISVGQVCEWAGLANAGGDFMPVGIVGCVNNPATDQHHGPDKNTLNNEKASRGVGGRENIHIICSECHNSTHAANDDFYPEYDRVADQERPWLPIYPEGWEPSEPRKATTAELMAEEERRAADRARRGRKTRGRNSRARGDVNTEVRDESEVPEDE